MTQPFLFILQSSHAKLLLTLHQQVFFPFTHTLPHFLVASKCASLALAVSMGPGAAALHKLVHPRGKQWVGGNGKGAP